MAAFSELLRREPGVLHLGVFDLERCGLVPRGRVTFDEWVRVGGFLRGVEESVGWWLGDWCNLGESTFGEKYAQALSSTDYDYSTLSKFAWVARAIPICLRRQTVSLSVCKEIAALPETARATALDDAETEGWTVLEARKAVRERKTRAALSAVPSGRFALVYADPWRGQRPVDLDVLLGLPVRTVLAPMAAVVLRIPAKYLPDVPRILDAWGIPYRSFAYVQPRHELLVLGVSHPDLAGELPAVIDVPTGEEASVPIFRALAAMLPAGSALSLFPNPHLPVSWATWQGAAGHGASPAA